MWRRDFFGGLDRRAGIENGGNEMRLKDQKALVTGGSRGLGLGLVEALAEAGAEVTVVARGNADLAAVHDRLGVATIAADVTDADAARTILAEVRPDVLALIAGALPPHATAARGVLGGFHRGVGHRRQGGPLLDASGVEDPAGARQPHSRRLQRRGAEWLAALWRICRRQAYVVDHGRATPTAFRTSSTWGFSSRCSSRARWLAAPGWVGSGQKPTPGEWA